MRAFLLPAEEEAVAGSREAFKARQQRQLFVCA
jgi:hypothetical protein